MRLASVSLLTISVIAVTLLSGYAAAAGPSLDAAKTLAVVPVKSGKIDKSVYSQFDRLVPELKKISKSRILRLVCRYSGQPDREQDIDAAYNLAAHIQKYLLARHNLDLDLWIAVDITSTLPKKSPVLTLAVFPEEIKKLDAVLMNPIRK
jgi:hypothetical protein